MTGPPSQRSLFGPADEPLSVSALVERLRAAVEERFARVWVEGEISNLASAPSGHLYFTLKDDRSQLAAVLYRTQRRSLRFAPEDGMRVLARGAASLYAARGALQLVVATLEPRGKGALMLAFEQLKAKLAAEGLFARERKRPLPLMPRRIGVVTSTAGAALRDVLNVLARRYGNVRLVISPTRVQGEGAAVEIAAALRALARVPEIDVVLVTRGGGSIEDLWAFNEEAVARAIAACPVPVISAVGHETDLTIADLVADLRAATPSAAAELVLNTKAELTTRLAELERRLAAASRARLSVARLALVRLTTQRALAAIASLPARHAQRVDELSLRLGAATRRRLELARGRLELAQRSLAGLDVRQRLARRRERTVALEALLERALRERLALERARLVRIGATLRALSPYNVLERGYAIAMDAAGVVLRDTTTVAPGDAIRLRLRNGGLLLSVVAYDEPGERQP